MHHVIIGAGPAGVVAAEALRKLDPEAQITMIGAESEPPYSRMAIPYFLIKDIQIEGTYLRKNNTHFQQLNIDVRQNRVTNIDTNGRQLVLDDGSSVAFDKLLIATGSTPTRPPISGMDLPGVHSCWTLADARAIVAKAEPGSRVLLMGAGFIGCIILEALARRGVDLTVVEMENRMVPRMMNQESGTLIKRWCESKGVRVLTSTKVTGLTQKAAPHDTPEPQTSGGLFSSIKRLFSAPPPAPAAAPSTPDDAQIHVAFDTVAGEDFDLVIAATGVRANTRVVEGTGIDVDQGILVNDHLETNIEGIFAAGDVCQGKDFSTGEGSVQAIQPTAAEHARIAATNMVRPGSHQHRGSVNMNVLDTMGLISCSFGAWEGVEGGDTVELKDLENYRYLQLQFKDDILVGANSLGHTQHVGVLRGLVQTQVKLGPWKARLMENPTRVMEAYLACAQPAPVISGRRR